jgi:serine/threonine-protein kinase
MAVRKVGTARIVKELGRGGMGVVYEATQEELGRRVAVKALDPKLGKSKEISERFRREGKAYAALRHTAIVTVHDLVEKEDGGLFLITELVDGIDLTKLLEKGGALPAACVAVIGARLAEALDYVHFMKLLHRDVKPGNVMVSREGEVKLMDFGIAKDQTAKDLTKDGMLVGSPSYLAPELLGGDPSDTKSDLWSLGVTLYELASGEKPFKGKDAETLFSAIRKGEHPKLRAIAPGVPRRLARAIERCLHVKPRSRWRDAGSLARELERVAAKLLVGFHPQGRLVALMSHRGFSEEKEALTYVDARSLLETRLADEAGPLPRAPRSPWRWALVVLVAAGAGVAAWLIRF